MAVIRRLKSKDPSPYLQNKTGKQRYLIEFSRYLPHRVHWRKSNLPGASKANQYSLMSLGNILNSSTVRGFPTLLQSSLSFINNIRNIFPSIFSDRQYSAEGFCQSGFVNLEQTCGCIRVRGTVLKLTALLNARKLGIRLNEHRKTMQACDLKSAMSEHARDTGHSMSTGQV